MAEHGDRLPVRDDPSRSIFRLVETHDPLDGQLVDRLTDHTGMSERTLRRRCHELFGYGPKTLERILRFQRFMGLARGAVLQTLAGIAAEAGYADQAHLARETRELAGFTPSAVVAQLAS